MADFLGLCVANSAERKNSSEGEFMSSLLGLIIRHASKKERGFKNRYHDFVVGFVTKVFHPCEFNRLMEDIGTRYFKDEFNMGGVYGSTVKETLVLIAKSNPGKKISKKDIVKLCKLCKTNSSCSDATVSTTLSNISNFKCENPCPEDFPFDRLGGGNYRSRF